MGRERKMEGAQFLRVHGFWVSPEGSECTGVSRHLPEASVGISRGIIRINSTLPRQRPGTALCLGRGQVVTAYCLGSSQEGGDGLTFP